MKVLKGTLQETLYEMPSKKAVGQPLKVEKVTTFGANEVTYISDEVGLHCVSNPDPKNIAVSLHLYTPPWAEKRGCYCFCPKTGKRSLVKMSNYYSVHGKVGLRRNWQLNNGFSFVSFLVFLFCCFLFTRITIGTY